MKATPYDAIQNNATTRAGTIKLWQLAVIQKPKKNLSFVQVFSV